ncbi:hypothetical protein KIN20_016960 [Parelaphostrongylus tenuis]|uniref:Uncharacterized protein n=1 Tax=Parelaphostrongylus tenuis TaxID=148309 RepID=A0AAD5N1Y5_PARTN|nr:hypothetical protein KIN20_016960 [Parelaphostrongylus tenuis]
MQSAKENLNPETPRVNEMKKRPSLNSPSSAVSPSIRPLQKKVKPLHEVEDQNLEATISGEETFDVSGVKLELEESRACISTSFSIVRPADSNIEESLLERTGIHEPAVIQEKSGPYNVADSNLEETAIESTAYEEYLEQPTMSEELMDVTYKANSCPGPEGIGSKKDERSFYGVADANLEETSVESTIHLSDMTQATVSEELDETIYKTISCTTLESNEFSKGEESFNGVADGNLEETALESTFHIADMTQATVSEELDETIYKTDSRTTPESSEFSKREKSFYGVADGNLEETAVESTASGTFLALTTDSKELDDTVHKTISRMQLEDSESHKEKDNFRYIADGNLEETAVESTVCEVDMTQKTGSEDLDDTLNRTITYAEPEVTEKSEQGVVNLAKEVEEMDDASSPPSETHISATFNVSILDEASVMKENLPSVSERKAGFKKSFSPILCLPRRDDNASSCTTSAALGQFADHSPAVSRNRMYNLNDSDISFLINENRVYDLALRGAFDPPNEVEQLKKNLIALEGEKALAHEQLRFLSDEVEKYKKESTAQNSQLQEANRNLSELTKSKEYAERTVADYEYIVEQIKKNYAREKEGYHAKILSLESELEQLRTRCPSQSQETSTSFIEDLFIPNERLLLAEQAKADAEERCEKVTQELKLALSSAVSYAEEVAAAKENSAILEGKLEALKNVIEENSADLKVLRDQSEKIRLEMQMELEELESGLVKSEEESRELLKQLVASKDEMAVVREAHATCEMELMSAKDELRRTEIALRESEERQLKAFEQCLAVEEELKGLRAKLDSKEELETSVEKLKDECALLQQKLCAEQLRYDVCSRELEQLRQENNVCNEALKQANLALTEAETRADAVEKDLSDRIKCLTEDFTSRITELEGEMRRYIVEKDRLEVALVKQQEIESSITLKNKELVESLEKAHAAQRELQKVNEDLLSQAMLMKQSENDHISEKEKMCASIAKLESVVETLKAEACSKSEELVATNEKLKTEILANGQRASAYASLEEEYIRLKKAKEALNIELEEQKNRYVSEVNSAHSTKLQNKLTSEEASARQKMDNMATEISRSAKNERLGDLCDEFDEIEANYRQEIFALIKERDELNKQLHPSQYPEVPDLEVAFTEGMETLAVGKSLSHSNVDASLKSKENEDLLMEVQELRRRCAFQERRINDLEKICDEADESEEKMKSEISELIKKVAALEASASGTFICAPSNDIGRDEAKIVSSPQESFLPSDRLTAGHNVEVSAIEGAGTPNRTLQAAMYKRLDKTAKNYLIAPKPAE